MSSLTVILVTWDIQNLFFYDKSQYVNYHYITENEFNIMRHCACFWISITTIKKKKKKNENSQKDLQK